MKIKHFLLPLPLLAAQVACNNQAVTEKNQVSEISGQPNIIMFFCDDMGWGDAGCYGQEKIQTPNIDKLAAQGIRFTNAYSASPVSAPSRSCLMTGQHGGHTIIRNNKAVSGELVNFNDSTFTMAKMLKNAGYTTGLFGKWGLGEAGTEGIPTKQGFDEFYGFLNQRTAHHYYVDSLWHNDKKIAVPLSKENQYSSADWYMDKAVNWIKENKDNKFFCYIPTQLPHLYMPYKPLDIYKNKPWPEGDKRWASMISMIDNHLGRIMQLVDELGIANNTLILFMSDNGGGNGQRVYYHNTRFFKSNAHFRGMKRDLYEGGIRVPFIAQWKSVIQPGKVSNEPVVYYDLMNTVAELINQKINDVDGESLVKLFTGEADTLQREYIYWEFPYKDFANAKFAVRKGKWKAVKEYENQELQIYNLEEDPEEIFNWVKEMPELAKEMEKIIKKEHHTSEYWPLRSEMKP